VYLVYRFWIDLGALAGTIIAADGFPVQPARHPAPAIAQRLDVLIDLPGNVAYPIFAQVEGKRAARGSSSQRPTPLCHASPWRPEKMPVSHDPSGEMVEQATARNRMSSRAVVSIRDSPL
jgi:FtsP/CotA-like multicopper oxidase with cupredoxin domain